MGKIIAYETPDGVAICTPAYNDQLFKKRKMRDDKILALVLKKDVPQGVPYKILDSVPTAVYRVDRRDWRFCPKNGVRLKTEEE